ncbi:MAG: hypothetical protein LBN11_08430, partial [Tannerella sp.]|nr:hypothetical protein [Tannerella sp.]
MEESHSLSLIFMEQVEKTIKIVFLWIFYLPLQLEINIINMKIKSILIAAMGVFCLASCCNAEKKTSGVVVTETVVEELKKEKVVVAARVKVKDG